MEELTEQYFSESLQKMLDIKKATGKRLGFVPCFCFNRDRIGDKEYRELAELTTKNAISPRGGD